MATYKCEICSITYQRSRFSKYCKSCKHEAMLRYERKRQKEKREELKSKLTRIKIQNCVVCEKVFVSRNPKKYCSKICKKIVASEYKKQYTEKNKEVIKEKNAEYYLKNKEKINKRNKKYELKNQEKVRKRRKQWRKENPEKQAVHSSNRRARKRNATLNLDLNSQFNKIYSKRIKLQKNTGIKHNVDHIIPLKNDNICGLHVPWNLQILTFEENMIKGCKFDGTYDNKSWKQNENS